MSAGALSSGTTWLAPMLRSVALGAVLGGAAVAARRLGPASAELAAAPAALLGKVNASVGPVWLPMLLVGARVSWLAARAIRTRRGRALASAPVRPELGQLAPLFAALGLCGTVWGLSAAFGALREGEFLTRLPVLLGGLGTAMTSTLLGLGLQIATLLLAAFNPTWSLARVVGCGESASFALDARDLGSGATGLESLVCAIESRQPEALRVEVARDVPREWRARVHNALWQRLDSAIPTREVEV